MMNFKMGEGVKLTIAFDEIQVKVVNGTVTLDFMNKGVNYILCEAHIVENGVTVFNGLDGALFVNATLT